MSLSFNEYQEKAVSLAEYPNRGFNLIYPALGLAGEAGETVDKIKKLWRNSNKTATHQLTDEERNALVKELGDVLWYVSALAAELNFQLEDVAQINLDKLFDRRARNVIRSEGDNR